MNDLSKLRLRNDEKISPSPEKRPWKVVAVVGALIVIFFSIYLLMQKTYINKSDTNREIVPSVNREQEVSAPPVTDTRPTTIMAGGFVEAERSAAVYPGRDGLVETVHVKEGQFVEKGDLLAVLVTTLVKQEVAIAQAEKNAAIARLQLLLAGTRKEDLNEQEKRVVAIKSKWKNAKENLQTLEQLAFSGAVARRDLSEASYLEQQLRAEVEAEVERFKSKQSGPRLKEITEARANVERAISTLALSKEKLALSYIRAPFAGVVIDVKLESGEALSMMTGSEGDMGIKLADVSILYVKVDIPEASIAEVRTGAKTDVIVDAIKNISLQGVVNMISPVADRQSNTVEVSVRIENPPSILRPGMSARVSIHLNTEGGYEND